eukprot:c16235_g1_i1.p1 GENE.c16235_g1_i1~~c16235_g1_i1.p1  ORF type:complete len:221 (-),score=11.36 c16235_g1_i1:380-1042(-)
MFSIIISNNFGSQMAERGQGYQGGRGRGRGRRGRGNHNGPRHVYQTNTPEESRPRSQSRPFSNQRDQETVGQRGQQTRFVQVFPVRSPTNTQESNGQPNYAPAQKSTSHLDSPCSPSQSDPAVAPFPASAVSVSEFSFGEHNHSSFTQHQAAGESRVTARPQTDLHARIEQLESQLRDLAFLPCLIEELTKFATKQGDDIAALRTELGVVGKGFEVQLVI